MQTELEKKPTRHAGAVRRSGFSLALFTALSITFSGCSSMGLEQRATAAPMFNFVEFFTGQQRVSGWFSDRFGNVKRHFCGDFYGSVRDDGVLVLDESLYYSDGMVETRVWDVSVDDEGNFRGESDSLVGAATGKIRGNAMNIKYVMNVQIDESTNWALSMNDFMFLQPDGSLHNITHVYKYGQQRCSYVKCCLEACCNF